MNEQYTVIKRALDWLFALILLIVLCPILIILAILIRLESKGPAIYQQRRVGANEIEFIMLKFRTMKVGAPVLSTEDMQQQSTIPFTRLGPILRKTSLDELPQLINILKGEMSFIGPRPALTSQTDVNELRAKMGITALTPGITGLAQVMGRDNLDNTTKVDYDREYAQRMSLLFDMKMLILTVVAVFSSRGNK